MDRGNIATIIMAALALSGVVITALFNFASSRKKTDVDASGIIGTNYSMLVNRLGRDIDRIDKDRGAQRQETQALLSQIEVMHRETEKQQTHIMNLERKNRELTERVSHLEAVMEQHGIKA